MSRYIDELVNLKLYKTNFFIPINKKDKRKGSCILLLTPSYESSKKIMLSPKLLNYNMFQSYYMERNINFIISQDDTIKEGVMVPSLGLDNEFIINESFFRTKDCFIALSENTSRYSSKLKKILYAERIKTAKDVLLKYDSVKDEMPFIKKTYLNYDMYKQHNLFVDWSYYTEIFYKNNMYKLDKGLDLYFEFINKFIKDGRLDAAGYTKKTVMIPIEGWPVVEDTDVWNYTKNINPISVIYRYMRQRSTKLDAWKDIDVLFVSEYGYFKVNFNEFVIKNLSKFISNISGIINKDAIVDDEIKDSPDAIVTTIVDKLELGTQIKIQNLTGGGKTLSKEEVNDKISKALVSSNNDDKKEAFVAAIKSKASEHSNDEEVLDDINNDTDIKKLIIDMNQNEDDGVKLSASRVARINSLNDQFMNKKIANNTVKELIDNISKDTPIPKSDVPINSIDDEWKNLTYPNFGKTYNINEDIMDIMAGLNSKSVPISVSDLTITDISTSEDSLELYTFKLEDAYGKRMSLVFELPKFKGDRFMKLRGNEKVINGQLLRLPIIKTDEDTVQIISNYNKIFIRRYGTTTGKSYPVVNKIIKTLAKLKDNKNCKIIVTPGDNSKICAKYELPIDYIDLSSIASKIEYDHTTYYFNQDEIRAKYKVDDSQGLPFGYNDEHKVLLYADGSGHPLSLILHNALSADESYNKIASTILNAKRYTYSKASILNTEIPVIVIMGYSEGLQSALKKSNIDYKIVDKREKYNKDIKDCIKFSDGYLIFDLDFNSSLLLNGLKECNTEDYSIKDINSKPMWINFLDQYGGRIKADGLDNFYDLMMDPITVSVCKEYDLPFDYVEALGYANLLLSDNKYNRHVDISGTRFRSNEIVTAYAYKAIADAYGEYKNQLKRNRKDATISMKRSKIIDSLLTCTTASDLSILSPLLELESANAVSFKGPSGMNSDRSYGLDKRTYDDSMINKVAMSTGFAGNVGITRQTTIDMGISGRRGLIKGVAKVDDMSDSKTLCMTEALVPFGTTHDDPFRTAMSFIQTAKHGMRTKISDPLLVTSGADQALPYLTSDTFAFKAKDSGEVTEITEDHMIIKYTPNGSKPSFDFIDLRDNVKKNSDGGFFLTIKLDTDLKVGSKFKKGSIVAYDKTSYSNKVGDGSELAYNVGVLTKIAIMSTDEGFEDSAIITQHLSNAMTSKIIIKKDGIVLPKNSNVYNMVKKGQAIQEGEPLLIFQNSFDDETANSLLKTLTDDEGQISELGRIPIKSKVTGIVKDIKIYRTVEKSELSSSLKKIVNTYEKDITDNKKAIAKYNIDTSEFDSDSKLDATGKLKNAQDSVMIEFYLEYNDKMSVGDKLVYYSALKGVVKDIIPEGKEPYTDFRPNEKIHSVLAVSSLDNRMVTSIIIIGCINKILIEMDRKVKDIMGVKWGSLDEE